MMDSQKQPKLSWIYIGKTTVAELSRQFDVPPSEIVQWINHASKGLENALKAKPQDVKLSIKPR